MAKNIDWLDQFANDQYKQLKKTASINKIAEQIIVNCSAYPNAKIGSLVDYENNKYKVIDTEYHDKSGPGILLEKVADLESPTASGEVSVKDGTVPASTTENGANCGDPTCGLPKTAAAAAANEEEDILADFDDSNSNDDEITLTAASEYPSIIPEPGGVKPIASAPIEGPNKKNVTDAPYHPIFDPGEQYALDSLDEWQDAADRTLKTIEKEDSIDRTTVEGHYTWNTEIDNMLDDVPAGTSKDYDSLAEFDDSSSEEDINTDTDDNIDIDEDIDMDKDTDNVDEAVDTLVEDEELPADDESIEDENISDDEEIDLDIDEDEEIPADEVDEEIADEDLPDDDELEDIDTDNDLEDEEIPDEEEDKKVAAASISPTRRISRLAYKNN